MEQTLVIIKPDGVQRRLVGEIITRFEKRGLRIVAAMFGKICYASAVKLYEVHEGRDYFERLIEFITSGPVFVLVLEAEGVVGVVRQMVGSTFGRSALPGTIRGDLCCTSDAANIVHASDQVVNAKREITLFFTIEEIVERY